MGKGAKQKNNKFRKPKQIRKKQVEEVFKKGRTQRELAKKLEDKINRRHLKAGGKKLNKKTKISSGFGKMTKAHTVILDKKLANMNQVRRPSTKNIKVGPLAINSAIDCFTKMQLD